MKLCWLFIIRGENYLKKFGTSSEFKDSFTVVEVYFTKNILNTTKQ